MAQPTKPTSKESITRPSPTFPVEILPLLRCPVSGEKLEIQQDKLVSESGKYHYRLDEMGIPRFADHACSAEAKIQEEHYDLISTAYIENLGYPHTQEYLAYLDRALTDVLGNKPIGTAAEICCGAGEAFQLYQAKISAGIGVDISTGMLAAAKCKFVEKNLHFIQGDATMLPLANNAFDTVFMLGGIHHVNDRNQLFSEIFRILKPGGRFIWREPVSDFWLWRLLRSVIYRFSPMLDHETERPLLFSETVPVLEKVGMTVEIWRTVGFIGFCLFMNSDVLYFNRFFRFIPGIRAITRAFIALDDMTCQFPGLKRSGLIVVGCASKPEA